LNTLNYFVELGFNVAPESITQTPPGWKVVELLGVALNMAE
jgi:hypothetical protein